eukprot:752127-Prymnesium_polylepis.1
MRRAEAVEVGDVAVVQEFVALRRLRPRRSRAITLVALHDGARRRRCVECRRMNGGEHIVVPLPVVPRIDVRVAKAVVL